MENLNLISLEENSQKLEEAILEAHKKYYEDAAIKELLESNFLEPNREKSFQRFKSSKEFSIIYKLLHIFSASKEICEIGGGAGFLSWAISKSMGCEIDLVEPNSNYITGTGYLTTLSHAIKIFNNVKAWHSNEKKYQTIITKNCIHHFQNIALVAATIRQKMNPEGIWFAFREWFADSPQELYKMLEEHPFSQNHNLYEWPYPAHHYIEAIEMAGFKLKAIIPAGYANNCLAWYSEGEWDLKTVKFTKKIDKMLTKNPNITVKKFWKEHRKNKLKNANLRFYTRPQLMVFKRIEY